MRATDVATFLARVQMPAIQHLLSGSLEPTRAAINALSPEHDPQQWVSLHLVLGTALRLRAPHLPPLERTIACSEALSAFECVLAACNPPPPARPLRQSRVGTKQFSLQTSACASGPDGVQMVVDASSVPMFAGLEMLESAIRVLTDEARGVERLAEPRRWLVARSNLGCALTMLGQRTHGMEGLRRIEESIDILREAALFAADEDLLEERASLYVNMSGAFQALAERAMPGERLRHIERSLDWIAAALGLFAPEDYQWLLQMDRAAIA